MPTTIIHLPRRFMPPPPDPREQSVRIDPYRATPDSIAHAKVEAAKERAEVDAANREYDMRRVDAIEALSLLVDEHGAARVQSWLRNVAAIKGETV